MRYAAVYLAALLLLSVGPAIAQNAQAGRVANLSVGQRQTREQAAPNVNPMDRVGGSIQNRVQSRIRNRIDRYYNPQANALSPFTVASDQARVGDRSTRR